MFGPRRKLGQLCLPDQLIRANLWVLSCVKMLLHSTAGQTWLVDTPPSVVTPNIYSPVATMDILLVHQSTLPPLYSGICWYFWAYFRLPTDQVERTHFSAKTTHVRKSNASLKYLKQGLFKFPNKPKIWKKTNEKQEKSNFYRKAPSLHCGWAGWSPVTSHRHSDLITLGGRSHLHPLA